jgi:hypothetical protein
VGIAEWIVVVLLAAGALSVLLAFRRLRWIRDGGVNVALRRKLDDKGTGWRLGVGHYRGDDFLWYRVIGLRSRPDQVISRAGLTISDRRPPTMPESYAMPAGATVVRCEGAGSEGAASRLELAMGDETMTGFLSWLESAPPGRSVPWAS